MADRPYKLPANYIIECNLVFSDLEQNHCAQDKNEKPLV